VRWVANASTGGALLARIRKTRWKQWRLSIVLFFSVLGPGIITANVDNDAGGIYTYSVAGARFGYSLLWSLIPITIALVVVQEMVARMGVVTGKGLADLIREEYGFRITFLLMMMLLLADLGNTISEFAGLASGMSVFGVSRYIGSPPGMASCGQRDLPVCGKGLSRGLCLLYRIYNFWIHGKAGLEGGHLRYCNA
jgi:hypothetical protein